MCPEVWQTVMTRIFANWTKEAEWCAMLDSHANVDYSVTQSLVNIGAIPDEDEDLVASWFRPKIWKPNVEGDSRCMFLYHGGNTVNKYFTIGCLHRQRATTLTPGPRFKHNLQNYWS